MNGFVHENVYERVVKDISLMNSKIIHLKIMPLIYDV